MVDLSHNYLAGEISRELGQSPHLAILRITNNALSGSIPPELGNIDSLQVLNLSVNALTGSIPPELGNIDSLQVLNLSVNALSGSIPPELGNLVDLSEMYLNDNKLSGSIPPQLGNLIHLERLSLSRNQLAGRIPVEFTEWITMPAIRPEFNQNLRIGDPLPADIKMKALINLGLAENQLTDVPDPQTFFLDGRYFWDQEAWGIEVVPWYPRPNPNPVQRPVSPMPTIPFFPPCWILCNDRECPDGWQHIDRLTTF